MCIVITIAIRRDRESVFVDNNCDQDVVHDQQFGKERYVTETKLFIS